MEQDIPAEGMEKVQAILDKIRVNRLPGETDGWSVYRITFEDGCNYYGHTSNTITWKVEDLCNPEHKDAVPFLVLHDQQMSKTLDCLLSGIDSGGKARAVANPIVEQVQEKHEEMRQAGTAPPRCPIEEHLFNLKAATIRRFHNRT